MTDLLDQLRKAAEASDPTKWPPSLRASMDDFHAIATPSAILALLDQRVAALAEAKRLREALTPSNETKAAYFGEFSFPIDRDENARYVDVPWTTIKEIMAAIRARSALKESEQP